MADAPTTPNDSSDEEEGGSPVSLVISAAFVVVWMVLWLLHRSDPGGLWTLPFTLSQVAVVSIVIWQVCDPFADAAQWVGARFRLPGSVRGATLDAVASSLPELFSGIFFVVIAIGEVSAGGDAAVTADALEKAGAEGYGSTIATCAGSAVYNMILIPAFCALVISYARPERPTIDVEDEVISRDGVWFLSTQILLIMFLFQESMAWWMGVSFILLYLVYIGQLYLDAVSYRKKMDLLNAHLSKHGSDSPVREVMESLRAQGTKVSAVLVLKAQQEFEEDGANDEEDDDVDSAGVFFGYFGVPLNGVTTVLVLSVSTVIVAVACYFLVKATVDTARMLEIPPFFVAVILAAAASSVPDTFLAIAAARRGDDSGAVSNAFGSNIFDICICLSVPLLLNTWLTNWEPVSLLQDGRPIAGLVGLRVLLVILTVVNLAFMWHNRQITRRKALVMCGLYLVFVAYAVLGSLGVMV